LVNHLSLVVADRLEHRFIQPIQRSRSYFLTGSDTLTTVQGRCTRWMNGSDVLKPAVFSCTTSGMLANTAGPHARFFESYSIALGREPASRRTTQRAKE
jgi:hypothetical protein